PDTVSPRYSPTSPAPAPSFKAKCVAAPDNGPGVRCNRNRSPPEGERPPMSNDHIAERIAASAQKPRARIAVAESLTSGALASALGAAPDAAESFAGGIVAYNSDVKHNLLRSEERRVGKECRSWGAASVVERRATI